MSARGRWTPNEKMRLARAMRRRLGIGEKSIYGAAPVFRGDETLARVSLHVRERFEKKGERMRWGDPLWPKQILRLYKDALRKVAKGEWRGVPRKLRREVWRLLHDALRDSNNKPVRVRPRHRIVLTTLITFAMTGRLRLERVA